MRILLALCLVAACGGDKPGNSGDDAPGDAAGSDDAGTDDAPTDAEITSTCGGETCRADQSCIADTCTFACSGQNVPGDYATVQAAVTALGATQGAVICLRGESYTAPANLGGAGLTIIGVSASKTSLTGVPSIFTTGNVTLKSLTVDGALNLHGRGATTTITGVRVTGGIQIQRERTGSAVAGHKAILDGVDVTGGVHLFDANCNNCDGKVELEVINSYLHDADDCLRYDESGNRTQYVIHAINNTLVGCMRGIYAPTVIDPAGSPIHTIELRNNIVANHSIVGITHESAGSMNSQTVFTTANNALFGNTNNYADGALDGPGYVKQDCLLSGTPPVLGAGSPCLGAGSATNAPDHDFWGHPRSTPLDIGATESP